MDDDPTDGPLFDSPLRPLVGTLFGFVAVGSATLASPLFAVAFGLLAAAVLAFALADLLGVEPAPLAPFAVALAAIPVAVVAAGRGMTFATGVFAGTTLGGFAETYRLLSA